MALKTKIRSMRFSPELEDLINQQIGDTFTAKFDRLVYNCYMLAPQKEKEIQELDKQIARKKELLRILSHNYLELNSAATNVTLQLGRIRDHLSNLESLAEVDFDSDFCDDPEKLEKIL